MKNLVSKHPMFTGSAQDPYTVGQVSFVRALELGGLGIMNLSICMRTSQIARSTSLFASSVSVNFHTNPFMSVTLHSPALVLHTRT